MNLILQKMACMLLMISCAIACSDLEPDVERQMQLADYYSRALSSEYTWFAGKLKMMARSRVRYLKPPHWYIWIAKDAYDVKKIVQNIAAQCNVECICVNLRSNQQFREKGGICDLFSEANNRAEAAKKPVILFLEQSDFLVNTDQADVCGVRPLDLYYNIRSHKRSENLVVVIHVSSAQNMNKHFNEYLDCPQQLLPDLNAEFREKFSSSQFERYGVTINHEVHRLFIERTNGLTLTELRDAVDQTVELASADGGSVTCDHIKKWGAMRKQCSMTKRRLVSILCLNQRFVDTMLLMMILGTATTLMVYARHVCNKGETKSEKCKQI